MDQQKIKKHYKFIIVGGGIVGAGILRDLVLHNQDVLLIDKGDFSSQTSQGSSKMLHGGIRYLENLDFLLVFEALKEKKNWLKLAPHIAHEQRFYLPVYKDSKWPLFFLRLGLFLYDLLSFFKNPPFKILNRAKTLQGLPGLKSTGLKGAGLYSDGVIDDSKLVFDLLFDAQNKGAHILNYHELIKQKTININQKEVVIENTLDKTQKTLSCDILIFALGPFTDLVMNKLNIPWENIILPSKGSHLWLKKDALMIKEAMVLQTKDGRIIFVIPQRNAILVGTTEVELKKDEDIFNIKASKEEINYLINTVNEYFPKTPISQEDIISTTAAVRPLVKTSTDQSKAKTSRRHKIYQPEKSIYVIAGGKYTTFRVMACDLLKKIFKEIDLTYNSKKSLTPLDHKSLIANIHEEKMSKEKLQRVINEEMVQTKEDLIKRRLSLYDIKQYEYPEELKSLLDKISIPESTNDKKDPL